MSKILIVVVLVLAVIAVAQLARLYELTRALKNSREEDISYANNKLNASLWIIFMVVFYAFCIWLVVAYGDKMLPVSASEHGNYIDSLMNWNMALVWLVFFTTNTALFVFAAKYVSKPGRKALYYPHNNKLEVIWTVIPAIVLAVIIIYGLLGWNRITDVASEDAIKIELYSKQFDWTARYAGKDGKLGQASFNLLSAQNALGIVSQETLDGKLAELEEEIANAEDALENQVFSDVKEKEAEVRLRRLKAQKLRILSLQKDPSKINDGLDDKIVKAEFHLPIGKEVEFEFRSQDVIHSAYMPHFRAQMNTVPGMVTRFKFTPTITTDSMRTITGNPDFNYILLCNKICGASHYNMKMDIIVESQADYEKWLAGEKEFRTILGLDNKEEAAEETPSVEAAEEATTEEVVAENNINN